MPLPTLRDLVLRLFSGPTQRCRPAPGEESVRVSPTYVWSVAEKLEALATDPVIPISAARRGKALFQIKIARRCLPHDLPSAAYALRQVYGGIRHEAKL